MRISDFFIGFLFLLELSSFSDYGIINLYHRKLVRYKEI